MTQLGENYVSQVGTLVESFDTVGDWTAAGTGSIAAVTSDIKEGSAALRLTSLGGGVSEFATKTVSLNLSNADTFWIWIKPDNNTTFRLGFTSQTDFSSSYFEASISTGVHLFNDKWNLIRFAKSDFTNNGGESWSNTMIRMRARASASGPGVPGSVTVDELRTDLYIRPKCILTCDGAGNRTTLTEALPRMRALGLRGGVLYVQTNRYQDANVGIGTGMTISDLRTLESGGWDIGNHTYSHQSLGEISLAEARSEVSLADMWLRENNFRGADHFAYPSASETDDVIEILDEYCTTSRKTTAYVSPIPIPHYHRVHCMSVKQTETATDMITAIDEAITKGGLIVFMFEGLNASPSEQEFSTSEFQTAMEYLCKKQAQIDVVNLTDFLRGLDNPRKIAY